MLSAENCFQNGGGFGNCDAIAFCDSCSLGSAMLEAAQAPRILVISTPERVNAPQSEASHLRGAGCVESRAVRLGGIVWLQMGALQAGASRLAGNWNRQAGSQSSAPEPPFQNRISSCCKLRYPAAATWELHLPATSRCQWLPAQNVLWSNTTISRCGSRCKGTHPTSTFLFHSSSEKLTASSKPVAQPKLYLRSFCDKSSQWLMCGHFSANNEPRVASIIRSPRTPMPASCFAASVGKRSRPSRSGSSTSKAHGIYKGHKTRVGNQRSPMVNPRLRPNQASANMTRTTSQLW